MVHFVYKLRITVIKVLQLCSYFFHIIVMNDGQVLYLKN